jgi:hypothetical protein
VVLVAAGEEKDDGRNHKHHANNREGIAESQDKGLTLDQGHAFASKNLQGMPHAVGAAVPISRWKCGES